MTRNDIWKLRAYLQSQTLFGARLPDNVLYHLDQCESIFDRSPLKIGDRAKLCVELDLKIDHGWYPLRNSLKLGQIGTIKSMDFSDGRFFWNWEPDNQTWAHYLTNEERPVQQPYVFGMWEGQLVPQESASEAKLEKYNFNQTD